MNLSIHKNVPEGLIDITVQDLHAKYPGPFLVHLKGQKEEALFLSVLLHGNEVTGLFALQKLLKKYQDKELPRDLIILVGNTKAAAQGQRHLEDQPDYNRIWRGGDSPEAKLIDQVMAYVREFKLFANIDVHNNTGMNPYYGCVNVCKPKYLHLASGFSDKTVYFTEPKEVESMAFAPLCPSVTVEAGLPGKAEGVDRVVQFVEEIMALDSFNENFDPSKVNVFHTIGRIKISKEAKVDFLNSKDSDSDFSFIGNLETKNFSFLPQGTLLGFCKNPSLIKVVGNNGEDITEHFIRIENNQIITSKMFIPSMFTQDLYILKEDCLGYVMEEYFAI
ncbi:MAG: succinylglutamate desuccinylase/aspartoacylase family protein [Bacteriovoracaceae bacterium]|nr:succinylglutamate desuccinylase/aspartoacylase family protein [Bacteriovoracaceae bacterium]